MIWKFLYIYWQDTAGQERFHALGPIYYRDSQGALLVYDITDEDSFEKVGIDYSYVHRVIPLGGPVWHLCCCSNIVCLLSEYNELRVCDLLYADLSKTLSSL